MLTEEPGIARGRPRLRLVAAHGHMLGCGEMTGAAQPRNGDEDDPRPLSKAEAEELLIGTLARIERDLAEGEELWSEAVEWRARLRARRGRRRPQ